MEQIAMWALGLLAGAGAFLVLNLYALPALELRKAIAEVRRILTLHAPTIHTPIGRTPARSDQAADALRAISSDLFAKVQAMPHYPTVAALMALTPRQDIEEAATHLRAIATHMHETGSYANDRLEVIEKRVGKVEKLLRLAPRK